MYLQMICAFWSGHWWNTPWRISQQPRYSRSNRKFNKPLGYDLWAKLMHFYRASECKCICLCYAATIVSCNIIFVRSEIQQILKRVNKNLTVGFRRVVIFTISGHRLWLCREIDRMVLSRCRNTAKTNINSPSFLLTPAFVAAWAFKYLDALMKSIIFGLVFLDESIPKLQMKGRWESNINVQVVIYIFLTMKLLFPKQNNNVMFCLPYLHSYICEIFTYFQDRSAYSAAEKYVVDWSWEYTNRSQTHACGNWDWGRAIPRKGIHKWDFPYSACCITEHLVSHHFFFSCSLLAHFSFMLCIFIPFIYKIVILVRVVGGWTWGYPLSGWYRTRQHLRLPGILLTAVTNTIAAKKLFEKGRGSIEILNHALKCWCVIH